MNLPLLAAHHMLAGTLAASGIASWLDELSAGQLAGIAVALVVALMVIGAAWLIVGLLGRQGELLLRLEEMETRLHDASPQSPEREVTGLPARIAAPTFSLPDLTGGTTSLDMLRDAGRNVILLFISPGCAACASMLPGIVEWQRDHAEWVTLAMVSRGTIAENRAEIGDLAIGPVLVQADREVSLAYRVDLTPSAVVVLADGRIGSPVVVGPEAIGDLVRNVVSAAAGRDVARLSTIPVGELAPTFTLPTLTAGAVSLDDFRGTPTLLVFWRPSCGFCQRLLPDLVAWEANRDAASPHMLIVSSGTVEENRALGLQSTIVLDDTLATGLAYGAQGTPAAVLIDADGRIASELAAGQPDVLALVTSTTTPAPARPDTHAPSASPTGQPAWPTGRTGRLSTG